MNFVITKIVNKKEDFVSWRIHPVGDFYKTILILKNPDLRDILTQVICQDPLICYFLKDLLK